MSRAPTMVLWLVGALWAQHAFSSDQIANQGYSLLADILSESPEERESAAKALLERADRSLVPGLVDAFFFTPKPSRSQISAVLEALTGEKHSDYYDWVEYVGLHDEIEPASGYLAWKRSLLSRIDQNYLTVLYEGAPSRIRLEEIVWGGVPLAGIPALDEPPTLPGASARYLSRREKVFGIVLAGEARAYPLRILSWHELLNDNLGGEPIALSFCTLCGSGIFYRTLDPNDGAYRFDTSGLLYRSNKLMVDRRTRSLWSNLTGEPVIGRLVGTGARIEMLPGTVTTWEAWFRQHPETTVLDLDGIEEQMRPRYSFDYRPGAADRSRRGVSFPVWLSNSVLEPDRQVFALRLAGGAKAFPVDQVLELRVVNDQVGDEPIVVIGDPSSGAVRAYRRGSNVFQPVAEGLLQDAEGGRWRVDEEILRAVEPLAAKGDLERLPGHLALWFGWYGFFPQTEVWRQGSDKMMVYTEDQNH